MFTLIMTALVVLAVLGILFRIVNMSTVEQFSTSRERTVVYESNEAFLARMDELLGLDKETSR